MIHLLFMERRDVCPASSANHHPIDNCGKFGGDMSFATVAFPGANSEAVRLPRV